MIERLRYGTSHGEMEGDLYRPAGHGPYPGVVVCLGVVPFGVDHPQVPRLGRALARSGFAALLYWSPAMRDRRLDPVDSEDIARAYERLIARSDVDAARSGLIGACVGGAFALMAAAQPALRERVVFICAYAPYASMWTLTRDIASASRVRRAIREPWQVDQLTRRVYERTLTSFLPTGVPTDPPEGAGLPGSASAPADAGSAVTALLAPLTVEEAEAALRRLPATLQERLRAMSPLTYARDLHIPLIVLCHDRDDPVIPVSETRTLTRVLSQTSRVRYTEFTVFQHLDPTKGKASWFALLWELGRFWRAVYPLFRLVAVRDSG